MRSQPTICYTPDYTSFKFTEENEGMKEEKAYNESSLKDLVVSDLKSQDHKIVADEKPNRKVVRTPLEATEDKIDGEHNCALDSSEESTDRKRDFNTKGSADCELPELVVFLQERSFHFVKDICIDKGMHSHGSCLVENCELDHKFISCMLEYDANSKTSDSKGQNAVTLSHILKDSKTTEEQGGCKRNHRTEQKESSNSKEDLDFDAKDESSTDYSTKEIINESERLVGEVHKAVLTQSMVPLAQKVEKNDDDNNSQTSTSISTLKEVELESGQNSCNGDSSAATTSGTEDVPRSPDSHQQGPETGNVPISTGDESTSHVHQHLDAESSPFSSGRFSSHIAAAHHGAAEPSFRSISHRSNSSTTSSRSFAFPILASEWQGSPERMATPDRRRLRARRGKFARFLCCQF